MVGRKSWWSWGLFTLVGTLIVAGAVFKMGMAKQPKLSGGDSVAALMQRMSVEEKVGQLIISGFDGTTYDDEAQTLITQLNVGGIILFNTRNMTSPRQTATLTRSLQRFASAAGAGVGLFIGTDEEGGPVMRLPGGADFPGNMALGAAGSDALARAQGQAIAQELLAVGINVDFAPVLDVNSNPRNPVIGTRSFGSYPDLVAKLGVAVMDGLQSGGVVAVAKHFPGHGDTDVDSHVGLPVAQHNLDQLNAIDLPPFAAAVKAGIGAVMTAHIVEPGIDASGLPSTLDPNVIDGTLRKRLGFDGVVFTDALEMGAIVKNYGIGEAAVRAIEAGADVVMVAWPKDWSVVIDVDKALLAAVQSGRISPARLDQSVRRILELKARYEILHPAAPDPETAELGVTSADNVALANTIAHDAVTLVRDRDHLLPLPATTARIVVIGPTVAGHNLAELGSERSGASLGDLLKARFPKATMVGLTMAWNPNAAQQQGLLAQVNDGDTVVVAADRALAAPGETALIEALARRAVHLVVVGVREPYGLMEMPDLGTYITAYSWQTSALSAVADVLAGRSEAKGKLPVEIPGINDHTGAGSAL